MCVCVCTKDEKTRYSKDVFIHLRLMCQRLTFRFSVRC